MSQKKKFSPAPAIQNLPFSIVSVDASLLPNRLLSAVFLARMYFLGIIKASSRDHWAMGQFNYLLTSMYRVDIMIANEQVERRRSASEAASLMSREFLWAGRKIFDRAVKSVM